MASGAYEYRISAASVGDRAWDVFERALSGSVIGVTSGGVFIRAGTDRIVFISRIGYRSPLTITLGPDRSALQLLDVGMSAEFRPQQLFFPEPCLLISADPMVRWTGQPIAALRVDGSGGIPERLSDLGVRVYKQKGDIGLGVLLPSLLGLPNFEEAPTLEAEKVAAVYTVLKEGRSSSVEKALISLLGLGRGLTPSGDDLLVGFLLTLNRWRGALRPRIDMDRLNASIIAEAYQVTTHLSANLIECAAAGAADERLLDGVDFMVTGRGNPDLIANRLAEMGSSSGVDSLVGIMFAFEACGMLLS